MALLKLVALLPLLCALAATAAATSNVTAVDELDIQKYMGDWYEIARLPQIFQVRCAANNQAHYTLNEDNTVAVNNTCTDAKGNPVEALGVGKVPLADRPAELLVTFAPARLRFIPAVYAPYWVLALDSDYQWALVGEPSTTFLWILARDSTLDAATYESLKAIAVDQGYDLSHLIVSGSIA